MSITNIEIVAIVILVVGLKSSKNMEKKYFAPSELIINEDGSVFHLHMKPEQLASKVILVGDPGRVPGSRPHR